MINWRYEEFAYVIWLMEEEDTLDNNRGMSSYYYMMNQSTGKKSDLRKYNMDISLT